MFSPGARYRVVSPFLTVKEFSAARGFFTVPAGAIVETAGETASSGLVPIRVHGELLLAFSDDLRERSQCLSLDGGFRDPDARSSVSADAVLNGVTR
jgi:hypothetical protein